VANTYTVSPADVAAELPGLYPGGFSATSVPATAQVQSLIDAADTFITLTIRDNVGSNPANTDAAAVIAKRYIIETVKAQVLRIIYAGKDVTGLTAPYDLVAKSYLDSINLMGAQIIGTGQPSPLIVGHMTSRDLLVESWDLDPDTRGRF
jgi:hypothetical protein